MSFLLIYFLTKYFLGPYCVSDMVLGFEDANLNNAHPAVERRRRKTNKSALEFMYSGHRNSVSVGLAWSTSIGVVFITLQVILLCSQE